MSIATAIQNAQTKVANAYSAVSTKGGTLPTTQDLSNLPTAINSIPSGGSIPTYIAPRNNVNGVYKPDNTATTFTLNGATSIFGSLSYAFYDCTNLTSVDLSSLMYIDEDSQLYDTFYGCTGLTYIDLSGLIRINGSYAMQSCFRGCSNITEVDMSSIQKIDCLSSLSAPLENCFRDCTSLTTVTIGGTTPINFTGRYKYHFNNMFNGCTQDITLNIATDEATLSTFEGYPKFGATGNVTINYTAVTE